MNKIIILENQPLVNTFLQDYIEKMFPRMYKIYHCTSKQTFLNLINDHDISMVISELKWYQPNSVKPEYTFDIIKMCKSKSIPCLIYSSYPNPNYLTKCIQLGAKGIVLKISQLSCLAEAIHTVAKGDKYLCNLTAQYVSTEIIEKEKINQPVLTNRQIEIFQLKIKGFSDVQISDALCIEICSVRKHRKIAREKNDCNNDEMIQMINLWHPTF